MPLLFSYGTLQDGDVQLATFGRPLDGRRDDLPKFEAALVRIEDPGLAERLGRTHHANVRFNGNEGSRVPGMALEVTEGELERADVYEAPFLYERVLFVLGSGREAWVYVHGHRGPGRPDRA